MAFAVCATALIATPERAYASYLKLPDLTLANKNQWPLTVNDMTNVSLIQVGESSGSFGITGSSTNPSTPGLSSTITLNGNFNNQSSRGFTFYGLQVPVSGSNRLSFGYMGAYPVVAKGENILFSYPKSLIGVSRFESSIISYDFVVGGGATLAAVSFDGVSWTQIIPGADGEWTATQPVYGVLVSAVFNGSINNSGESFIGVTQLPVCYRVVDDGNDRVVDAVNDQTDRIMSTDGSDSIVDSVTSGGESGLMDRLGFIGTAVQLPASIIDGFTSTADSTVQFPGVSIPEFGFSLPAQTVDVWAYFPELMTPCKTICTGVFIFAWLHGVKSLYDRITGKEQEVSIVEE